MRRFIAALSAAALLAASTPALAAGHGHGHYGYGHYRGSHGGHYYRGHHGHDYTGAIVLGTLAGVLVLGHLLSRPVYYAPPPPPPPRLAIGNCLPTTGVGYVNGRQAEFGGTMCYDQFGRAYILNGSEYFIGYLR
jgi:hypothetical protein